MRIDRFCLTHVLRSHLDIAEIPEGPVRQHVFDSLLPILSVIEEQVFKPLSTMSLTIPPALPEQAVAELMASVETQLQAAVSSVATAFIVELVSLQRRLSERDLTEAPGT